jgi:peptide/nickel transport system substrate-binding protein
VNRVKTALTASLVALTMTVAACGGGSSGSKSDASASPDAAKNAAATLRVVVPSISQFLGNPFQAVSPPRAESTSAIFDALTRVNDAGVLTPWLAKSWKRLSDTSWQFTLRTDVTFSNGEPVDADAVVATVTALTGAAGTGSVAKLFIPNIASATKVDAATVNINTTIADGVLPQEVGALYVVPPKYLAQVGIDGFSKAPIGTGPYTVTTISTTEIDLKANPTSWRKPIIGNLQIKQVADQTARTNAILSNAADINTGLDLDQIDNVKAKKFTVFPLKNQAVFLLQFVAATGGTKPLDSPLVRQALNYAVDRESVIKSVFQGLTTVASQGLAPGTAGYDADIKPYPYDPAKAKALLTQAGYPNGFDLTGVYSLGAFAGDKEFLAEAQSDLAKVGVKLTLNQDTTANLTSYLLKGAWPADMFTTAYLTAPSQDATKGYSSNSCLRKPGSWCDQTQAALISKALGQTVGSPERAATLKSLAEAIHDNPPGLFFNNGLKVIAYSNTLAGYKIDTSTNTSWETVYFK